MDKLQYYRILGIREDATQEQIRRAYTTRLSRLKSSDYEDEPEYAMRKMEELQNAYNMVSGSVPPAGGTARKPKGRSFEETNRKQKEHTIREERRSGESREKFRTLERDGETYAEKSRKKLSDIKARTREAAKTVSTLADSTAQARRSSHNRPGQSDKKQLGMMGIVLSVLLAVFPLMINACESSDSYPDYDYTYDYDDAVSSMDLTEERQLERLDWILEIKENYDYMGNLSDEADEDIFVEAAPTEDESSQYNFSMAVYELLNSMGVDYSWQNVDRLVGGEDYLMDHSDYQTVKAIRKAIGAPSYKKVAGKENLYRNEVITDYQMYLDFICDVLQEQTPELAGGSTTT